MYVACVIETQHFVKTKSGEERAQKLIEVPHPVRKKIKYFLSVCSSFNTSTFQKLIAWKEEEARINWGKVDFRVEGWD